MRTIRENLTHTRLEANARVVRADVFDFLLREVEPFDYVFVAPPQYEGLWVKALRALDANPGWVSDSGWAIVQIDPLEYEDLALDHLTLFDQRSYGGVMLCFYAKIQASEEPEVSSESH